MHRSTFAIVAAPCALVFIAGTAAKAQEVDLRPKFERSAQSRLVMTTKSKNTITPKGQDADKSEQISDQEITFLERVVSTDPEKGATVELVYERIKVKIQSDALGDFEFDSAGSSKKDPSGTPSPGKPGDATGPNPFITPSNKRPEPAKPVRKPDGLDVLPDLLKPQMEGIAGTVLTLKFDTNGNITSVTGGERLNAGGGLAGAMVGLPTFPSDAKSLSGLFGPISSTTTGGAKDTKPGFRRVGDKWTNTTDTSVGPFGEIRLVTEHALRSAAAGQAEVTFSGRAASKSESPGSAPIGLPNAVYKGKYTWDTRTGQLRSMDSEQVTDMDGPSVKLNGTTNVKVERRSGGSVPGSNDPMRPAKPMR